MITIPDLNYTIQNDNSYSVEISLDDQRDDLLNKCGSFYLPIGFWEMMIPKTFSPGVLPLYADSYNFKGKQYIKIYEPVLGLLDILIWDSKMKYYKGEIDDKYFINLKCENKLAYQFRVNSRPGFSDFNGYLSFLDANNDTEVITMLKSLKKGKNTNAKGLSFLLNQKKNKKNKKKIKSFKVQPNIDDLKNDNCCQKVNCNKNGNCNKKEKKKKKKNNKKKKKKKKKKRRRKRRKITKRRKNNKKNNKNNKKKKNNK